MSIELGNVYTFKLIEILHEKYYLFKNLIFFEMYSILVCLYC